MNDIVTTYKYAWRAVSEKVVVRYRSRGAPGQFFAHLGRTEPPTIKITRGGQRPGNERLDQSHEPSEFFSDGRALTPEELLRELIILCHEFGHFTSFAEKTPKDDWTLYKQALDKMDAASALFSDVEDQQRQVENDLTPEERGRIFPEEELAWRIGREFFETLDGVGAGELKTFDREKNNALDTYRFLIASAQ